MRHVFLLIAAAVLLLTITSVQAYPNLNAETGILAVPTADVAPPHTLEGAADVLFFDDTTFNARALVGLGGGFEAGLGFATGADDVIGLSAKYRFPVGLAGFNWAVGASLVTADEGDDGTQVFLAGTRTIGTDLGVGGLRGTIGINFTDIESVSAFRPFVGAQLMLATRTEIAGEFVFESGDFDESILSLLLRQRFGRGVTGELGFTSAFGFTGESDHSFFAGVAYTFGTP